ncbi:hypothetical protein L3Y19_gp101 [Gordonia phage Neville]|uniref:Uncharacterized protein n=1 Tax=Gordonia phage Neville TaxID=2301693 RepID=A0A385DY88_9CAUD|nr:hypothetical protein L3Y19_gp101 [Gordonia phage Neville]AXQ64500.1 hypothetical protein SEA_NEVILLE_129 [Gordonia phage Neville]
MEFGIANFPVCYRELAGVRGVPAASLTWGYARSGPSLARSGPQPQTGHPWTHVP